MFQKQQFGYCVIISLKHPTRWHSQKQDCVTWKTGKRHFHLVFLPRWGSRSGYGGQQRPSFNTVNKHRLWLWPLTALQLLVAGSSFRFPQHRLIFSSCSLCVWFIENSHSASYGHIFYLSFTSQPCVSRGWSISSIVNSVWLRWDHSQDLMMVFLF